MKTNIIVTLIRKILNALEGVKSFRDFIVSIFVSFKSLRYLRFRSIYSIAVNQTKFTGIDAMSLIIILALL
ncbi:MAG TPA: hypothetical protein PK253_02430, partial [Spirochaetota bacterium]|nr:hypothetical protein [Spirochaetota bacterium]